MKYVAICYYKEHFRGTRHYNSGLVISDFFDDKKSAEICLEKYLKNPHYDLYVCERKSIVVAIDADQQSDTEYTMSSEMLKFLKEHLFSRCMN